MTKFAKWGDRNRKQQEFDRETITQTKAGVTYNVYDSIQEANVDTDIVEVMKKYHCQEDEAIKFLERKGGMKGLYGEFAELQEKAQNIPEIFALKEKADELFKNLPSEIRQKYGNNLEEFFKDLQEKAKGINQKTEPQTETQTDTKTEDKK